MLRGMYTSPKPLASDICHGNNMGLVSLVEET
jgi:hypothetical protein